MNNKDIDKELINISKKIREVDLALHNRCDDLKESSESTHETLQVILDHISILTSQLREVSDFQSRTTDSLESIANSLKNIIANQSKQQFLPLEEED